MRAHDWQSHNRSRHCRCKLEEFPCHCVPPNSAVGDDRHSPLGIPHFSVVQRSAKFPRDVRSTLIFNTIDFFQTIREVAAHKWIRARAYPTHHRTGSADSDTCAKTERLIRSPEVTQ